MSRPHRGTGPRPGLWMGQHFRAGRFRSTLFANDHDGEECPIAPGTRRPTMGRLAGTQSRSAARPTANEESVGAPGTDVFAPT